LLFGLALARVLPAQSQPVELKAEVGSTFKFIVYGDTRFTDPHDHEAANPEVRRALVAAIAREKPAFLCFGGDIVYNGNNADDWKVYDAETKPWRDQGLKVYPALGNHDLHGDPAVALGNYFARYPELQSSRYYAVDAGSVLIVVLDSSLSETDQAQGEWLRGKLEHLPKQVKFVVVLMHHPPYTSSSDAKKFGGGHSARTSEAALARYLEAKQKELSAKIVVFAGHVHNYERHEHGGVTYFVTGGGGAHAYPIERASGDPFQSNEINYHYLIVSVTPGEMKVVMRRLELKDGREVWTEADSESFRVR
jgi:Icc-related predicted phosphoesterase